MDRRTFLTVASACSAVRGEEMDAGLPDFSWCGYRGGGVPLPDYPVRLEVSPAAGDATGRIQKAIDSLAAAPVAQRGAIVLRKGEYSIGGALQIRASGILLRGESGTTLIATGKDRRALVSLHGRAAVAAERGPAIVDDVVPLGSRTFTVANASGLRVGQLVLVRRAGNAAWIREIGMDRIAERPGVPGSTKQWSPFDLDFERVITGIDGRKITIDAPVLCAIERKWGGGIVLPFDDSGRIRGSGVQDLRAVSAFDKSLTATYGREKETYFSDEQHADTFVQMDHAVDCWVSGATALCFSFACVDMKRTRHVTVQDCHCGDMVSQITGSRRYPFSVSGQRTLVERCTADTGRHDFAVGARVAGPNAFLDCKAGRSFATSEPHHRWSVGGLYDNVKANIAIQDRQYMGTGHGWAGANYVVWNCEGSLVCQSPPTAQNWAIGHVGPKLPGAFPPRGEGIWRSHGVHVKPRSLYLSQLGKRLSPK